MAQKILIIDDEPELSALLAERFEDRGFEVMTALDGLEGLALARRYQPDLIVLDVMMPKLDGYKLCRMLKFDERFRGTPIVMLTARNQAMDIQLGREQRADAYLTKPFDAQHVLETVDRLLADRAV